MMPIKHGYFGDYRVLGTLLDMKFQNREDSNMLKKHGPRRSGCAFQPDNSIT